LSHSHHKHDDKHDSPLVKPGFAGVALVCGDCQQRSNGPSGLKAKDVRSRLKSELRHAPVRLRVVECSCLGLCPKKAIAAAVAAGGKLVAAEIHSEKEAEAAAAGFARALRALG
jgi:predicted metal-binding protein